MLHCASPRGVAPGDAFLEQPALLHGASGIALRLAAYDYVVNGKPAIKWIMDRYQFSKDKDKDSQIVNDPNDWAREHDGPKYILNLLKSIITVSMETMKVVEKLPALNEKKQVQAMKVQHKKTKRVYSRKPIQDEFTALKVSRQRKWQLRRLKAGLCQICSAPAEPSGRCKKHCIQQALRQRKNFNSPRQNRGKWVGPPQNRPAGSKASSP